MLGGGFTQSIDTVADASEFEFDERKRTKHEVAVATKPIDSPIGPIEPGLVAPPPRGPHPEPSTASHGNVVFGQLAEPGTQRSWVACRDHVDPNNEPT